MTQTHNPATTLALIRDFFVAKNPEMRKDSLLRLAHAYPLLPEAAHILRLPDDSSHPYWRELEYAFNRIFVGPGPIPAPPYASVYLNHDKCLMGTGTLRVRALMHSLHLSVPHEGHDPDDFLPYELDLYLALTALSPAAVDAQARHWFLHEHLPHWLTLFIRQAQEANTTPAIALVLHLLEHICLPQNTEGFPD
ncbi:MAG: molecular chaperone TorD family protein [Desulfovibrionaceae bacterium]